MARSSALLAGIFTTFLQGYMTQITQLFGDCVRKGHKRVPKSYPADAIAD